jgi:NAD-dependent dihydropyrimidine dehydrogenase PreA subunit
LELTKLAKNGLLNINTYNMQLYFIVSTFALVVQNNRLYSSVNACPKCNACNHTCPWNHTIERILDHLLFQVAAYCFKLRHAVSSCGMLSNCASELESFESHIDLSQSIGGTLSCRDFFQQSVDPEQLTSSNQPTNWNNNGEKMVKVIQWF